MPGKKRICLVIAVLAILCVAGFAAYQSQDGRAFAQNIVIERDRIKVFIGSSRTLSQDLDAVTRAYTAERNEYISGLGESMNENQRITAVVVLNDYYSVPEIEEIVSRYSLTLDRAYLWMPGETGRLSLNVGGAALSTALAEFIETNHEDEFPDEQWMADLNRIASGEGKVFAMTVTAGYHDLIALNEDDRTLLADIKYDAKAEAKARKKGVSVNYIELPFKPDGAL
jgi:hypothetical protein